MNRTLTTLALGLVVALSACSALGPNYETPSASELDAPANWSKSASAVQVVASAKPWWSQMSDATLEALIAHARASSPTVSAAVARLQQSRALQGQVLAAGYPSVTGNTGANRVNNGSTISETVSLGTSSTWELDLFGAVQRGQEGAQARVSAKQADLVDAQSSLTADVVDAYGNYRYLEASIEVAQETLESLSATHQLVLLKMAAGFTAADQGLRAQASVAESQSQLRGLQAQQEIAFNRLVALTGVSRDTLPELLALAQSPNLVLPLTNLALPASVLERRPDLISAERTLAAASADLGLAKADQYPRLTLSGNFGYTSSVTGQGTLSLATWGFGPALSVPLFDGGRRAQAAEGAQARYAEALARYRQKARVAVQEVENSLSRYASATHRLSLISGAVQIQAQAKAAVAHRLQAGAVSRLDYEDSARLNYSAQQAELSLEFEQLQALHFTGPPARSPPRTPPSRVLRRT
jgi:multidrug efflux system outer membrane protein